MFGAPMSIAPVTLFGLGYWPPVNVRWQRDCLGPGLLAFAFDSFYLRALESGGAPPFGLSGPSCDSSDQNTETRCREQEPI